MTDNEVEDLRRTLGILHILRDLGVLEQVTRDDGMILWRAKRGAKSRLALIKKTITAFADDPELPL